MKKVIIVLLLLIPGFSIYCFTYYGAIAEHPGDWQVEAEYVEKYFEYDTYYDANGFYGLPDVILKGMDQDFVLRLGLPSQYFISLDANYVFQDLKGLYDYNNVQTLTLLGGKLPVNNMGLIAGLKIPLDSKINPDFRLINRNSEYSIIAGMTYNGSAGPVSYTAQAVFENGLRVSDYLGKEDLSAAAGFNFYNDPASQTIDLLAEIDYTSTQRVSGNSGELKIIPQARVKFYNDFDFIIGVEFLLNAENAFLNDESREYYVLKVNYVINSAVRNAAAASVSGTSSVPYPDSWNKTAPGQTTVTAAPIQVTATAIPVQATPTPFTVR
jgi:hypothetical protein